MDFVEFSIQAIMPSVNKDTYTSYLPFSMSCISFYSYFSSIMLNKSGERDILALLPILEGKISIFQQGV